MSSFSNWHIQEVTMASRTQPTQWKKDWIQNILKSDLLHSFNVVLYYSMTSKHIFNILYVYLFNFWYLVFLILKKIRGGLRDRLALCLCIRLCLPICVCVTPVSFIRKLMRSPCCLSVYPSMSVHLSIYPPLIFLSLWGLWDHLNIYIPSLIFSFSMQSVPHQRKVGD
jgi:hypothetical protein